ncbi:MAG: type VII toxin-antitoxin system HepT family RNase toxin [Candidatus Freyarchaeota archaeon]
MTDPELVKARLSRLQEYLKILRRISKYTLEEFKSNPERYGSAERFLQLAIECCVDIGSHIIASEGFRSPEDYADIFRVLGEHKIFPEEFVDQLVRMARFRNLLVHAYTKIDLDKVYTILTSNLEDLEKFADYVLKFIRAT